MAWTERLPSGKYRGGYRRPGSPKKHYVDGTFALRRDAREAGQEAEVKARREAARSAGTLSARISWSGWWDLIEPSRQFDSDNGVSETSIVKRYIRPQWGEEPLNRIEQQHVQAWVNELAAGNADGWERDRPPQPSYVRRIYDVFSASIGKAVTDGVLTASPCVGVKLPKIHKKPKAYLPLADAGKLELRADYRDLVDFGMETGLRPGELCGLHADRIDWHTKWLWVVEVYVERGKFIRPKPKDNDARKVPLSAKALAILRRQLDGRDQRAGCGLRHSDGTDCTSVLVFVRADGKSHTQHDLRNVMQRAAVKAGLPKRGGYTIRRGYATRLSTRLSAFEVAEYMGHASLEQAREYVQETPEARGRALAALGEAPELRAVPDVEQRGTKQDDRGAGRGADLDRTTPDDTVTEGEEHAL